MKNLKETIKNAKKKKIAIGHFNISDLTALKAIFAASQEASLALNGREATYKLKLPIIIGASEGEANFIGRRQAAALIRSLREEYNYPIFLNADHAHSLKEIKEAVEAGYDSVLFDAGKLSLDENIKQTKRAVKLAKSINPDILVEGELGYIGSSSKLLEGLPEGLSNLTSPEDAARFVKETGIDLVAPAVGNVHGIIKGGNPALDINRIKEIRAVVKVPLVLHGGSGISDDDFKKAIEAGISIIHINTELRVAWRKGMEKGLKKNPEETTPYKVLPEAVAEVKRVVVSRLKLFNNL